MSEPPTGAPRGILRDWRLPLCLAVIALAAHLSAPAGTADFGGLGRFVLVDEVRMGDEPGLAIHRYESPGAGLNLSLEGDKGFIQPETGRLTSRYERFVFDARPGTDMVLEKKTSSDRQQVMVNFTLSSGYGGVWSYGRPIRYYRFFSDEILPLPASAIDSDRMTIRLDYMGGLGGMDSFGWRVYARESPLDRLLAFAADLAWTLLALSLAIQGAMRLRLRVEPVFILVLLAVMLAKSPVLSLGYTHDEIFAAMNALIARYDGLNPYPADTAPFVGHPPFTSTVVAAGFFLFGDEPAGGHMVMMFLSALGVYYTYRLGEYAHSKAAGALSAALLFLSPLWFAQSGIINNDLPTVSLVLMAFYHFLKREWRRYFVSSALMVLSKEWAVVAVPIFLVDYLLNMRSDVKPSARRELLYIMSPLLVFGSWVAGNYASYGWLFWPTYSDAMFAGIGSLGFMDRMYQLVAAIYLGKSIVDLLVGHTANLLITAAIVVFALTSSNLYAKRASYRHFRGFVPVFYPLAHLTVVSISNFYWWLPRYQLYVLPFFYLMGAVALSEMLRKKWLICLAGALLALLLANDLVGAVDSPAKNMDILENGMDYADYVSTQMAALRYLEENRFGSLITADLGWGETYKFRNPRMGYVSNPLLFLDSNLVENNGDIYPEILVESAANGSRRSYSVRGETVGLSLLEGYCIRGRCTYVYDIAYPGRA
jgi:hypothetical protein